MYAKDEGIMGRREYLLKNGWSWVKKIKPKKYEYFQYGASVIIKPTIRVEK